MESRWTLPCFNPHLTDRHLQASLTAFSCGLSRLFLQVSSDIFYYVSELHGAAAFGHKLECFTQTLVSVLSPPSPLMWFLLSAAVVILSFAFKALSGFHPQADHFWTSLSPGCYQSITIFHCANVLNNISSAVQTALCAGSLNMNRFNKLNNLSQHIPGLCQSLKLACCWATIL